MNSVIFAFTYEPETKRLLYSGNVSLVLALKILQDAVMGGLLRKDTKEKEDMGTSTGNIPVVH